LSGAGATDIPVGAGSFRKLNLATVVPDDQVADPDANPRVLAAYAEMVSAPSRADRRLLVGQALRGWDFARPIDQPVTALIAAGLPAPAIIEVDLTAFGVTGGHDAALHSVLARHAAAGGPISLSFHASNPFNGGDVDNRDDVDLPQITHPEDPQTPAGSAWRDALDRAAAVIEQLAALDAVVLFRPLHESNGDWFWWGQTDPADFRATWLGMFRYLTATKKLHNVLWVYAANRNNDGALSDPTRLYPGDDLVDIVGLDIYDDDLSDAEPGAPGYAEMIGLGKPFGITEYGATNWPSAHDGAIHLPNSRVIQLIRQRYPGSVLATAWYSSNGNNWQISDKPDPQSLLLDPWAITLANP
jgi:mannan endo-1,4-beta-mannosidase